MWIFSCQLWAQRGLVPPAVCNPSPAASTRRYASPRPAGPQHQTSRRANRHTQRRVGCRSARSVLRARGRRRLLQRPFSAGRPGKEPGVVTTALSWGAHRWPRQAEGKPATGSAGGQRHPGLGLCLWRARPRAGLSGDCPLGQCLPSRHGAKAVNGQFRAVKLQTANKYVETGATVIPTSGCPERLLCPGTRSGRTPLGPRGSAASGPSTLFSMSRPGGREPHNGHPWPVSTALATAGKGRPGAQTSAQGGWRLCSRGPGSSPALSKLSRTRGSNSSCGPKTRAAKRPEGREALSPSRGTSTMGRPAGLWRCLRGREGAPRGRASGLPGFLPASCPGTAKGERGGTASAPRGPRVWGRARLPLRTSAVHNRHCRKSNG